MSNVDTNSLDNKFQDLELSIKVQDSREHCHRQALREAIICKDTCMEVKALKDLGISRHLKGKRCKDSAEFDKAAALYAAALLRCKDPDMEQMVKRRIGYMKKISRQLLQGYSPQCQFPDDYLSTADSNVVRVAETCDKLDKSVHESQQHIEETYTEMLVTAIENRDKFSEIEILKWLGDFYLKKGKKIFHDDQFSKAATMYMKALSICSKADKDIQQTLNQRLWNAKHIWEATKRELCKSSLTECMENIRTDSASHQDLQDTFQIFGYNEGFNSAIIQPNDLKFGMERSPINPSVERQPFPKTQPYPLRSNQHDDHLIEGDSSLARSDLDSAEQHFAAALKTVHVRDPTAQQYQREVEPLCKLGDVYSKRGQQTGDGGDFVKAAALYNAAIARSEDQVLNGNIETAIKEVEKAFLKCILDKHSNVSQDDIEKHKKQLKEMRDQIKLEMETIDQQLDPYVHDEDDPCVKEIEAKRAQAVRQLFDKIAQQRKEFISLLVEECIGLMGPPPCKYALIGLGSQATGLVTPYSDLEFVILVEEESEECLVYFRNLTHYLHLKVVNLGETILPALGIKSLNDFYSENPLDNWYYDSVTPRGFAFDGSMPKASKTPLGRQGTETKLPSELICTPQNMVSILQNDVTLYLKEGYHLATILRNPCLIAGDQDLIDMYMAITVEILQADGGKMAQQLAQEVQKENMESISNNETITARLIDVKKELYRFPAVAVDCLALSSGIIPTTVWETIEEMEKQQVISPNNAHHLTVLTSISAELRLRTYIANGGQKETFSALASMETALDAHERVDVADTEKMKLLLDTGGCWFHMGDYHKAISYLEQALPMYRSTYGQTHPWIAVLLNGLGMAWHYLGDPRKATSYHEQALQMRRSIYGQTKAHPHIAMSLNNLGSAWDTLGDYRKGISYYEQALQMCRSIYGQTKAHPYIATSLNNLGTAWSDLGDYRKAISYSKQALKMRRSIYGQTKAHPDIANSLNNLGSAWDNLGDYRKAISYHEHALQMKRSVYGQTKAHPEIATSLNNLGAAWDNPGALQVYRSIYGQTKAHPDIATSLNNLGSAWNNLCDYRKAISYHEQALQMRRSIYGQTKAHPDIVMSLNNLGMAWKQLGDHSKALSLCQEALVMARQVYPQEQTHPMIKVIEGNIDEISEELAAKLDQGFL
ncbi:hypothetical protein Bbelb_252100 [Branchiostoma belcheri]|nr:hypothetical protein Bbelb_252100 [Branchiostoma belcheri]